MSKEQIDRVYECFDFEDYEEVETLECDFEKKICKIYYFDNKRNSYGIYEPDLNEPETYNKLIYILSAIGGKNDKSIH